VRPGHSRALAGATEQGSLRVAEFRGGKGQLEMGACRRLGRKAEGSRLGGTRPWEGTGSHRAEVQRRGGFVQPEAGERGLEAEVGRGLEG
jgi:hypothetical protein